MSAAPNVQIHDVWAANVEEEFGRMRELIRDYPYVAMDTEFPGVVATPLGQFKSKEDFNYQQVSCNVNMLKLIQVGFALVNDKGELPPSGDVWQFNFMFSLGEDMFSQESVDMLRVAGIDFDRLQTDGISTAVFGELLTTSGLIVDDRITWITFSAGYDFGYLFRTITLQELPREEDHFFNYHRLLFPKAYDVKLLLRMQPCQAAKLKGGLQEIADQLDVKRIGARHQAGSDALLTAHTFFKIKQQFFQDSWDRVVSPVCAGRLFGLGDFLSISNSAHLLEEQAREQSVSG
ncbi:hypothetical protein PMAYCL1PPCAC_18984 [Pristionchus mayeri]|uniref:poly(A)-specific ribonuclease n=1 Tax=Pristionchus mayeri TaxID=1317129 RepID=A0AAN5CQY9_9BILA|nr:hypothetical protein PMAYCL1PPCAC_18984 [Pristionchus mayeri]